MSYYQPLYISKYETGLVESRQNFILPNDAYPTLINAYIWRERIKRKQGYKLLGKLRRVLTGQAIGNTDGAGNITVNLRTFLGIGATEPNSELQVGSVILSDGANTFTDNGS